MGESTTRKVALVTGAGSGIGKAIALELARAGYDIGLHHFEPQGPLAELQALFAGTGAETLPLECDLAEPGASGRLVEDCHAHFGRIDLLVNNAAAVSFGPFLGMTTPAFDHIYAVNLRAPYLLTQAVAATMIEQGDGGTIVNITSVHQERASANDSAYGSMKAALARATMSLALELGPAGIRVNAVAPGRISVPERASNSSESKETAIRSAIPLGRSGTPEDVARVVRFLASPDAAYITGIVLRVDGGMNIPLIQAQIDGRQEYF